MSREKFETTRIEKLILDHWDRSMRYMQDENKLINERVGRTLVIHGFLLTSFVLLIKLIAEAAQHTISMEVEFILKVIIIFIGIVGLRTSLSLEVGTKAAQLAIQSIEDNWKTFIDQHNGHEHLYLPKLTGGGSRKAAKDGFKSVKIICKRLDLI